jgi:diguanylate cyclase (GGDEF)-like protein
VARRVTDELVARVGGNPFTVVEYVRAVIDAGLITPSWGGWRLDLPGLNRLELSGDALDLVLQRIDGLGEESRRLLAAGAATGRQFRTDLVASVCGVNARQGREALAEAEARRLVTATGPGGYRFLHDRIREALLAELDPARLRRLHQRIAEVLDAAGSADPRYVYATARHYALGETDRTPEKVYSTGLAAGRLALVDHAPAEALDFLEVAGSAAENAGLTPSPDFYLAMGVSCTRTGRFAEAVRLFERALQGEREPLRRARVLEQLAWVHLGAWDPGRAFDVARQGLTAVGRPLPRGKLGLLVTTLFSFLTGLWIGLTKIGYGGADGQERERLRLAAVFYEAAGYASTMRMDFKTRGLISFRSLYVINRLGRGIEYTRAMAGFGLAADITGMHKLARRIFDRAATAAADIGDPVVIAHVEWERAAGQYVSAPGGGLAWMRSISENERWLEFGDYLTGLSGTCVHLLQNGLTRQAIGWHERGKARLLHGAKAEGAGFGTIDAIIPAHLGRFQEAADAIEQLRQFLALNPDNLTQVINLHAARTVVLVEQGELGAPFEQAIADFNATGVRPKDILTAQRLYHVYQAFGRLTQCHQAPRERRGALRAVAEKAVAELGKGATSYPLRAYHRVARADLKLLAGRPMAALRELVRADFEMVRVHAPLIEYEAARVRARALRVLGEHDHAAAQIRYALMLAAEEGWAHRARWIRDEFGVTETSAVLTTAGQTTTTGGGSTARSGGRTSLSGSSAGRSDPDAGRHAQDSGSAARSSSAEHTIVASSGTVSGAHRRPSAPLGGGNALNSRRLAALQQVSMAAATIIDPRDLARVALDQIVKILGAERAYLFLIDNDLDQLVPNIGRDAEGNDIEQLTKYSSTLVERVRETREPLVVTGSEEGVALGSRSAQIHGLRSIMIAPLLFNQRLLGVVYLDSRVAKGMFTTDDVDILTAIATHIASSLETARAAQLAVAVQAARQQRDVAETLRAAMTEQSATLDPDEVMRRLLRALARTVAGDAAVLLTRDDGTYAVTASYGSAAPVGTRLDPDAHAAADLASLRVGVVTDGRAPFGGALGTPRSWVAIPIAERGGPLGVLMVGSAHPDAMQEPRVEVAAALASQGATAYENARLFSEVRRLATIDGLTGLYNRNHFFAEAGKQFRIAQRYHRPVAAIMVDIDHFKQINDRYGHPVGDEVIRVVAERLRETARESDVLGRYGGEEFALVTPETGGEAAGLAERLRQEVCGEPVPTAAGPLQVTISVGMAYLDRGGVHLRQLLARADAALYEAKQNGRNRVATARLDVTPG